MTSELLIPAVDLIQGEGLDFRGAIPPGSALGDRKALAESLMMRRSIHSRNGVAWIGARSWRADAKDTDVAALKSAKARLDANVIKGAARDVAEVIRLLFGDPIGWTISTTAVGHSRRPDSFAVRLAQQVAKRTGRPFVKVFADRFVAGVSHPKEFRDLPPLRLRSKSKAPILIVDDVATSGWHIEEALQHLRGRGIPNFGVVWICGTIK